MLGTLTRSRFLRASTGLLLVGALAACTGEDTAEVSLTIAHPQVTHVAWSPDGGRLATGGRTFFAAEVDGARGGGHVWDATTGEELVTLRAQASVISYDPDGTHLAAGGDPVVVCDADSGEQLLAMPEWWWPYGYDDDGTRLAVGGAWGEVAVVDVATGALLLDLRGDPDGVEPASDVAWSPDGALLAIAGDGGRVVDVSTGDELISLVPRGTWVSAVGWSPDGDRVATAARDGGVTISDLATGDEVARLDGSTGVVTAVAWSPDGTMVATAGGDQGVTLWDPASGDALEVLGEAPGPTADVAWSPDGSRIATAGDGTVTIWDLG